MSPEAVVATHLSSSAKNLRRSQSSEDILECSSEAKAKDDEEGDNNGATKIGSLVVIPEPKYKSRGKFLDKLKGKRGGKGGGASREGSPVVLTKGHHSVSMPAFSDSSEFKSPKNKKRHRIPHFV